MDHRGTLRIEEAVLSVNKPQGISSFEVVRRIRDRFHLKKVGHAGTLDPFATGVLVILIGRATKRFDEFSGMEKEYEAVFEFGVETDTHDIAGKITRKVESLPDIPEQNLLSVLAKFEGEIEQVPPAYSAVKYKGKRLYKYARKGIQAPMMPRTVTIKEIRLVENNWPLVKLKITCSKGTYIRSLARDIGNELGVGAYVRELVRTRVGPFKLEDALSLDALLAVGGP